MLYYMSKGWVTLIAAKATLIVVPLFIVEWARRLRPVFVRRMLRFAIAAYLGMYAVAVMRSDLIEFGTPPAFAADVAQQETVDSEATMACTR